MARPHERSFSVWVHGAGKVGRALARALRRSGVKTTLRAARRGLPRRIDADVVVLAVRDTELRPLAEMLARARIVRRSAVVLHVAGALDATPLSPMRGLCAGVAQMHPCLAFASPRFSPSFAGCRVCIQGDPRAAARARQVAHLLRMKPWTVRQLDATLYHAAAGLVANGAAGLAALGAELLARAGVPPLIAPKILGPLLRSVADNVQTLGFPEALTGPVRRGDVQAVESHLAIVRRKLPKAVRLYAASVEAQLPLARAIGDASAENLERIAHITREITRRIARDALRV
jgi:predicted short-subunit dehydrogenase-like oxidoreductase (DUF2520 family)